MPDSKKVGMSSTDKSQQSKTGARDVGQQGKSASTSSQQNTGFNRTDKNVGSAGKKSQKDLDTDDDI